MEPPSARGCADREGLSDRPPRTRERHQGASTTADQHPMSQQLKGPDEGHDVEVDGASPRRKSLDRKRRRRASVVLLPPSSPLPLLQGRRPEARRSTLGGSRSIEIHALPIERDPLPPQAGC